MFEYGEMFWYVKKLKAIFCMNPTTQQAHTGNCQ